MFFQLFYILCKEFFTDFRVNRCFGGSVLLGFFLILSKKIVLWS